MNSGYPNPKSRQMTMAIKTGPESRRAFKALVQWQRRLQATPETIGKAAADARNLIQ
jgi:hypothetical protein